MIEKGPVFSTAFSPLMMIIVTIIDSTILSQSIYIGSVMGGVVIVVGFYCVVWGKVKDVKVSQCTTSASEFALPTKALPNKLENMEASETVADKIAE
ncbi:hypothetical protein SUGI_0947510 [Cryptomeria japonica]|nr:hypothetical protein SUGI_0947510 [Cryptomeria japonica]